LFKKPHGTGGGFFPKGGKKGVKINTNHRENIFTQAKEGEEKKRLNNFYFSREGGGNILSTTSRLLVTKEKGERKGKDISSSFPIEGKKKRGFEFSSV